MFNKTLTSMAFSALMFTAPLALAEEAHHPEEGVTAGTPPTTAATPSSGMTSGGAGMMGPGMGMMNQGMGKSGGMGMMGQGMGQGGGMGMMGRGAGKGDAMGMSGGCPRVAERRAKLDRVDLLEARLAKIETLLERLATR